MHEHGLILAPRGRDAAVAQSMLAEAGLATQICATLADLVAGLSDGAEYAIITEEGFGRADVRPLRRWLEEQPEWSDFPFILLTERGGGIERNPAATRFIELLGNVTFVERPFHPTTLISLTQAALRGRRRQYQARSQLRSLYESERQFRTLANSIPTLCWMADADGSIFWYNQQWYDYTGTQPEQMEGWGWQSVHDPDRLPEVMERWTHSIATGEAFEMTFPLRSASGEMQPFLTRIQPVRDGEGRVVRWFGTNTNIAAQQAAEAALRDLATDLERRVVERTTAHELALAQLHQAQKLETIGQLTGGVAHDFNNLLTPITGALDIIQRRFSTADPRTLALIDGAIRSAERARVLVQRLLGFARRQVLETKPVDLAALITEMRDLISSSLGGAIDLRLTATPGLPPALVDANQLELAVLNLCVNARDAMAGGGVLTVAVEPMTVEPGSGIDVTPGDYLRLAVTDTGVGMDAATLARAVEPFYSTKEQGRGTGLGLSMVHGFAAQLGGAFVLESEPGRGTCASLLLPIAVEEAASSARPDVSIDRVQKEALNLLLVDDEEVVRTATAAMLRDLGHHVTEAAGGADALEQLGGGLPVDVVITDYMMPQMNGAELAEEVRRKRPGQPILLITGYVGDDREVTGLAKLSKPFRQADLAKALAQF